MNIDQAVEYVKENWKGDSVLKHLKHLFDKNEIDDTETDRLKKFMSYGKELWILTTVDGLLTQYANFVSTVGIIWFFRYQGNRKWNLESVYVSKDRSEDSNIQATPPFRLGSPRGKQDERFAGTIDYACGM